MSENHDEFDAFLVDETEKQTAVISAEAEITLLYYAVVEELERYEAIHIWHPDEVERSTLVRTAFEASVTSGVSTDDTELAIQQRMISETTVVTLLQFVKAAEEADPEKDFTSNKKDILAQIRLRALGEQWETAFSSLFNGVTLDLDDEMNLLLPEIAAQDRDKNKHAKAIESIKRILAINTSEMDELNQETLNAMQTLKVVAISIGAAWGAGTIQKRAEAEGRLHELLADGHISYGQLQQLIMLLDQPDV